MKFGLGAKISGWSGVRPRGEKNVNFFSSNFCIFLTGNQKLTSLITLKPIKTPSIKISAEKCLFIHKLYVWYFNIPMTFFQRHSYYLWGQSKLVHLKKQKNWRKMFLTFFTPPGTTPDHPRNSAPRRNIKNPLGCS